MLRCKSTRGPRYGVKGPTRLETGEPGTDSPSVDRSPRDLVHAEPLRARPPREKRRDRDLLELVSVDEDALLVVFELEELEVEESESLPEPDELDEEDEEEEDEEESPKKARSRAIVRPPPSLELELLELESEELEELLELELEAALLAAEEARLLRLPRLPLRRCERRTPILRSFRRLSRAAAT